MKRTTAIIAAIVIAVLVAAMWATMQPSETESRGLGAVAAMQV